MATFFNQATLSYNGALTNSNITTGELEIGVSATKTAYSSGYGANDELTYIITLTNSGSALTNVTLTDDLGAYVVGATTATTVYPLEYVDGSVLLYNNGILGASPTAVAGPPLVFNGISVGAGDTVTIVYRARTNEYTLQTPGSVITNTATVTGEGLAEEITATATLPAEETTVLTIAKAICPPVVSDNGQLTYTFIIQNTGNTATVATDSLIVSDTFNPILNPITVTLDDVALVEGTGYTYDETTGVFSTLPGAITVPASTYYQDATTGVITTTPGVAVLRVTGTV